MNSEDSGMLYLSTTATARVKMDSRKGIRQPQISRASATDKESDRISAADSHAKVRGAHLQYTLMEEREHDRISAVLVRCVSSESITSTESWAVLPSST